MFDYFGYYCEWIINCVTAWYSDSDKPLFKPLMMIIAYVAVHYTIVMY